MAPSLVLFLMLRAISSALTDLLVPPGPVCVHPSLTAAAWKHLRFTSCHIYAITSVDSLLIPRDTGSQMQGRLELHTSAQTKQHILSSTYVVHAWLTPQLPTGQMCDALKHHAMFFGTWLYVSSASGEMENVLQLPGYVGQHGTLQEI